MNICLHINQIALPNVFLLDTKQNMVINGKFTKLIYSNEYFTMNGMFISFPIANWRIENVVNRSNYLCYPSNNGNQTVIQKFLSLESDIIELYREVNHCRKTLSPIFANQLNSCSLKITKDFYSKITAPDLIPNSNKRIVIKISGVWESADEIGVTYKITELYDV